MRLDSNKGDYMMSQSITREQVITAINNLWELHDQAEASGETDKANAFSFEAFKLLELLPENAIHLRTKQ